MSAALEARCARRRPSRNPLPPAASDWPRANAIDRMMPSLPMDRLIEICLNLIKFLPQISAVQSVKESATISAWFYIRLVNRNADQRRPRSSAPRLRGHTLCVLFTTRRNQPRHFRRPRRFACAPNQLAVYCRVPFAQPVAFDVVPGTRRRPRR
jgi:hypothetical protein